MVWLKRNNQEQNRVEAGLFKGFHAAALAAADSYDTAMHRVEDEASDVFALFGKLRNGHLEFADDFAKRVRKLGDTPDEPAGIAELGGRLITRINSVGSIRDLLIAMRQGEENGVAMCREALENGELSGRSRSLLESQLRSHVDAIRDLSEQIALRGTLAGSSAEFYAPQWLRFPRAGFWLLSSALVLLGYLFGRARAG